MTALPDVNVLVALAWPNHVHHAAAVEWFRAARDQGWATCPITESGFVRVSANPRISGGHVGPAAGCDVLERLIALGRHDFWADDISFVRSDTVPRHAVHGYRQVTDAHLLGLARVRGGRLVTFDRGVPGLAGSTTAEAVVLLRQ
ncbi:MAG: TA system VapC family ribonuclease toxin [Actinomycetota bacterium]|nr:TA system VapC family ribonuclease toxin [Actinomycetota bacterium]